MNLELSPVLASLFGNMTPQQYIAQNAPPQALQPQEPEIVVNSAPRQASQYRDRQGLLANLFPGTFRPGSGAGNILGALKDAFLIQAGRNPMYGPKLQQLRESEALENLRTDPGGALDKYLQVDPEGAQRLYGNINNEKRADASQALALQKYGDVRREQVSNVIRSMLAGSAPEALPAVKQRALQYLSSAGYSPEDLPFDINSINSADDLEQLRRGGLTPEQMGTETYRDRVTAISADKQRALENYYGQIARIRGQATNQAAPERKLPTPTTVIGAIQAKLARGEKLTPEQQRLYDDYNNRGKGGKQSLADKYKIKVVTGPDGKIRIQGTK